MRKSKKASHPPNRVWVVMDASSGHPVLVMNNPPDDRDIMDEEMVYEYELRREYGKRQ